MLTGVPQFNEFFVAKKKECIGQNCALAVKDKTDCAVNLYADAGMFR